jgi:hypothetical protein
MISKARLDRIRALPEPKQLEELRKLPAKEAKGVAQLLGISEVRLARLEKDQIGQAVVRRSSHRPDCGAAPGVTVGLSAAGVRRAGLAGAVGSHPVDPVRLRDEVFANLSQVPEFKRLADLADQHGYDVWALGGIAGNVVHHFRQRIRQRDGDASFRADYFSSLDLPRIMNVQTQDIDLVIARKDGCAETIEEIEEFQTQASAAVPGIDIDVRGLRTGKDDIHLPLLNEHDFLAQHHNTVDYLMVQLNASAPEQVVRDLADWNNPISKNLVDSANGVIRFDHSSEHSSTSIARDGHSPDIKHVMRLLIKMARYDAKPDPASLARMKQVVSDFDPKIADNVVARWFEKNAAKLAFDAIDLRSVWATLDELGLRPKLQQLELPELATLFCREPLGGAKKHSVGGETAKDLGIDYLAHGTNSLELWNAVCRTPYTRPNFFVSRRDADGEVAFLGEGVYAVEGKEGLGQGYNVVLRLAPDARKGVDFEVFEENAGGGRLKKRWVLLLNGSKVTLAPIELKFSSQDMIRELLSPESLKRKHVRDYYTTEMLRRPLDDEDRQFYAKLADELLDKTTRESGLQALEVIASVPSLLSASPALVNKIVAKLSDDNVHILNQILRDVGPCEFSRRLLNKALDSPCGTTLAMSLAQYFFPDVEPTTYRKELWHLIDLGHSGIHQYIIWSTLESSRLAQRLPDAYYLIGKTERLDHLDCLARNAEKAASDPNTTDYTRGKLDDLLAAIEKRRVIITHKRR